MTFPSDHEPVCSWCGCLMPAGRQVFCNDQCQERYNHAADAYFDARHEPAPPVEDRLAGQPIPGSGGQLDYFDLAASLARAHALLARPRTGR